MQPVKETVCHSVKEEATGHQRSKDLSRLSFIPSKDYVLYLDEVTFFNLTRFFILALYLFAEGNILFNL